MPSPYFHNNLPHIKYEQVDLLGTRRRCLSIIDELLKQQNNPCQRSLSCDGGLYVGLGGLAYMLYHVAKLAEFENVRSHYLQIADQYIRIQASYDFSNSDKNVKASFFLGKVGTLAVAAALANRLGDNSKCNYYVDELVKCAHICVPVNFLRCGGDELFVGRAGVLCAVHWLQKQINKEILSHKIIEDICTSILDSGISYANKHKSSSPLMYAYYGTEYLGAAHGLSSILQMLLCFSSCWETDANKTKIIKESIDYLLSLQQANGNFPCAMDEVGNERRPPSEELVHWCHGGPGIVYLMAKSYLHFKDPKYLESCVRCAENVWEKGLLRKGPGICHGIAGSGYVFLLLYRLTGDKTYLERSFAFAEFLYSDEFRNAARIPDTPNSLYEGLAGTVCFLADLIAPDLSSFPFFDVI